MTKDETRKVRLAAKSLLQRLHGGQPKVLVQDWFKDAQSKLRVRATVEDVLHMHLPETYDKTIFADKVNGVFDIMLDYAHQGIKWSA